MTKWTLCSGNKARLPCSGFPTHPHTQEHSSAPPPTLSTSTSQYSSRVWRWLRQARVGFLVVALSIKDVASLRGHQPLEHLAAPHRAEECTFSPENCTLYSPSLKDPGQPHILTSCGCICQTITPRAYRTLIPALGHSRSQCTSWGLVHDPVRHCGFPLPWGHDKGLRTPVQAGSGPGDKNQALSSGNPMY